jgi:hypothetical protein
MKNRLYTFFSALIFLIITAGCDDIVSDNYIILDTINSFEYHIDTETDNFSQTQRLPLQAILNEISGADEVNLYNVTVKIKNIGQTSPDTEITARLNLSRQTSDEVLTLVDISDAKLSQFENRQSIFLEDSNRITPNPEGVQVIQQIFKESPLPVIDLSIKGNVKRPSGAPQRVTFDFVITIYTQLSKKD